MEPRVSVLITFYNQEQYVDQALQSVIEQKTDFGVKILVGDDGSNDQTQERVRHWMDKFPGRIEMFVMERAPGKHVGGFRASRNRLNLLQRVTTEYFIFLDGDDWFSFDGKLARQVAILDDPANQDCVACGHDTDMLFADGRRTKMSSHALKEGKYSPREYWERLYFHTDSLLARSSVIPTIDARLLENNFNDNMITFAIIQRGSLYYLPFSWAVYRQTGDGIWTSGNAVVNHLRNLFLYDLCNRVNPALRPATERRFRHTWRSLLKLRRQIDATALAPYAQEAADKRLANSLAWIHYRELPWNQKSWLCLKAFGKRFGAIRRWLR